MLQGLESCSTLFESKIRSEPIFSQYQGSTYILRTLHEDIKNASETKEALDGAE